MDRRKSTDKTQEEIESLESNNRQLAAALNRTRQGLSKAIEELRIVKGETAALKAEIDDKCEEIGKERVAVEVMKKQALLLRQKLIQRQRKLGNTEEELRTRTDIFHRDVSAKHDYLRAYTRYYQGELENSNKKLREEERKVHDLRLRLAAYEGTGVPQLTEKTATLTEKQLKAKYV